MAETTLEGTDVTRPDISVVAVTPDCFQTIRKAVRALQLQTIRGAIELVIVAPVATRIDLSDPDLAGFHACTVVPVEAIGTTGWARAIGARAAGAPFVAFVEDHAFPEPGWAAALQAAHAQGYVAVGSQMHNANPRGMISWADLFLGFAPWVEPRKAGPAQRLPWHHTAYDRALLLSLGEDLEVLLDIEGVLHARLVAEGRRLYLADVRTSHVNISRPSSFLAGQFNGGQSFGGHRAREQRWRWYRRLSQAAVAPLIPLVRARRILAEVRACGRTRQLIPRMLPALLMGLAAHAAGEAAGYLRGPGRAGRRKADLEYHRDRHVSRRDGRSTESQSPPGPAPGVT